MSHQYIWTALLEKLLVCKITTIGITKQPQMEGMCGCVYATPPYLQDIYRKDEEK